MPVRSPPFVHDLAREHRIEIERLLANGEEHVALPCVELATVLGQEPQQVVLRVPRRGLVQRLLGRGCAGKRLPPLVERVGRLPGLPIAVSRRAWDGALIQRAVHVDVRLERERRVEHRLDALLAVIRERRLDAMRAGRRLLENASTRHLHRALEERVAPRKIRVPEHVRDDEHVLRERVRVDEIGLAGIAGKHHLEDPRVAHVPLHELADVANAERPVRHAHRKPVDRGLHHEAIGNELELDRVIAQPQLVRERLDAASAYSARMVIGLPSHDARCYRCLCPAVVAGPPKGERPTFFPMKNAQRCGHVLHQCHGSVFHRSARAFFIGQRTPFSPASARFIHWLLPRARRTGESPARCPSLPTRPDSRRVRRCSSARRRCSACRSARIARSRARLDVTHVVQPLAQLAQRHPAAWRSSVAFSPSDA